MKAQGKRQKAKGKRQLGIWPAFYLAPFAFCLWLLAYQLPLVQTIHVGGEARPPDEITARLEGNG